MAKIVAINVSDKKGTYKYPVEGAFLKESTASKAMRMPESGTGRSACLRRKA